MNYDQAVDYAIDLGIPDEHIDEVIDGAELCDRYGCDEGPCAENTMSIIKAAAKRYEVTI